MSNVPYAKWGSHSRIQRDIHDRKAEVFTTSDGDIVLSEDPYAGVDVVSITTYASNDSNYVKLSMPLARHIRILANIFGYETLKGMVDNMPEDIRIGGAADGE